MLIAALSTGNKVGLGLVGLAFVAFALISSFVLPALRPDFPGKRGLPAFLTLSATLFVGMMFAVFFFGREPSESHAAEGSKAASTTTPTETAASTTAPTTSASTTTAPAASAPTAPKSVPVTEVEFKIELANLREQLEQERAARKDVQLHVWPEEQPVAAQPGPVQAEQYLLCVPTSAGYVLLDRVGALPRVGQPVEVPEEEGRFTVTKVVRLPRNGRPCAYLQRA